MPNHTNIETDSTTLTDTGKTSPLTDLSSSSPSNQENTAGSNNNTGVSPSQVNEKRAKSIASDVSSELSDLDSEAETEKMESGQESQLLKLSKAHGLRDGDEREQKDDTEEADDTIRHDETMDNTLIKEEVSIELQKDKESNLEVDHSSEEFAKVVHEIRKSQELEDAKEENKQENTQNGNDTSVNGDHEEDSSDLKGIKDEANGTENGSVEDVVPEVTNDTVPESLPNGKRKLEEENELEEPAEENLESLKRRKTGDDTHTESVVEEIDGARTVEQEATNESDEDIGDQEDEEEEDEEEEEEVLTEEQKRQKQKEEEEELEKQRQRKEALQELTTIEIEFAKLRDRLYEDKMSRFKSELEMCLNGSHPELQTVYTKIDAHREEKIRLASLTQKYELECIDRKTKAQRTQIHQQYYKRTSDYRTKYLKDVMQGWDAINKERRNMDLEQYPEYQYKIPQYADELVRQRTQYNKEISVLVGLNDYYGFPTAPKLASVQGDELDNDLRAMNIKPNK